MPCGLEANRRYEEQQRARKLDQQVNDWNRSRLIREYIHDMKTNAQQPEKWNVDGIPPVQWMDWALGYADSIDPVGPIRNARAPSALRPLTEGSAGRTRK